MLTRTRRLAPTALAAVAALFAAFAFGVSSGLATPRTAPVVEAWPAAGITVAAHRCNTVGDIYTEQTQAACVKALAAGAGLIDTDVRWTSTNTPVALHNADLGVFGAPSVQIAAVSYTAARQYVSTEGQVLSTLTQLRDLALVSGADMSVELKTTPTAAQWSKVDSILAPVKGRVMLNSFDPALLSEAIARGYTRVALNSNTVPAPSAVPAGVGVVIVKASAITSQAADALVAEGVAVWCFQCDTPAAWQAAASQGVTGFATDDHVGARAWVAALPS